MSPVPYTYIPGLMKGHWQLISLEVGNYPYFTGRKVMALGVGVVGVLRGSWWRSVLGSRSVRASHMAQTSLSSQRNF